MNTQTSSSPRVVIVDDDSVISDCLASCLQRSGEAEVVGVARHAQEGVALAADLRPDVVLMDIHMHGASAFWACEEIGRLTDGASRVLFFTGFIRDHYVDRALAVGAAAMLSKHSETMQGVTAAIRHVCRGETYFSPEFAERLAGLDHGAAQSRINLLDHREIEVLRLMSIGKTNRDIADELTISLRSVEKEVADMKEKLRLGSTNELLIYAAREEIVYSELPPAANANAV